MSDEKDEKLEKEKETPETEALPPEDDDTSDDTSEDTSDETSEDTSAKAEAPTKRGRRRRRGSAETTTSAKREAVAAPRDAEGQVAVRAQAKYVRCAPRKARLVVDHIRGKSV